MDSREESPGFTEGNPNSRDMKMASINLAATSPIADNHEGYLHDEPDQKEASKTAQEDYSSGCFDSLLNIDRIVEEILNERISPPNKTFINKRMTGLIKMIMVLMIIKVITAISRIKQLVREYRPTSMISVQCCTFVMLSSVL